VKKEIKMFKKNCGYCRKEFIVNQYKRNQQFCSKECSISHSKEKGKKDKEQNKEKIKETLKLGKELNICTICKTSQLDCERFTSNFVYIPLGAKMKEIDGKFIIVSCPKFK
jgi:isopropylmalate/homocitrate/citramalate synthase